jgi:hypothetical protein
MVTDPLMKLSRLRASSVVPATFNSGTFLTIHSRAIKDLATRISGGLSFFSKKVDFANFFEFGGYL